MPHLRRSALLALLFACVTISTARAQRELTDIPVPDPELERQSFIVADGLEVNLFAADPALAKPIQINFDADGRLWCASSEVYPLIKPGQEATDRIVVLEDQDGDGVSDKTTLFAEGLLIPTGVEPGDGGAYVANSTELLHFTDTDGDGRADKKRVMLSGFGTEDTHHILHTLRWGHDGLLYFNQSIYIHSHIETPYGVRRLGGGGTWYFRPETMQLEVLMKGLVNPWGHHFDRYGQSFATDGAGGEGINYVFPGAVFCTSPGAARIMQGLNPGSPKYCGLEVLSGRHLPEEFQGDLITNDFRAHRVCRFKITEDGSGYASREMPELIKTSHVAFRPIDVKLGPDGAIYIADWYNPIIQHGEVDFRDPRRDHTHGRIWRVTAKGRPLVGRPQLTQATTEELLAQLAAPEDWTRHFAKRVLKERGTEAVLPLLEKWVAGIDASDAAREHDLLEALWMYQSLDIVEPKLLEKLLRAQDPHVRAAATRVVLHWHNRLDNALALLETQVRDEHPRVRLEAVCALAHVPSPRAANVAMTALDQPVDKSLDFALWTTARELAPYWLPELQAGSFDFGGDTKHLTFALEAVGSSDIVPALVGLVKNGTLPAERTESVLTLIATLGKPEDLAIVLDTVLNGSDEDAPRRAALLKALVTASSQRGVLPAGDLTSLRKLFENPNASLAAASVEAAGAWKQESLRDALAAVLGNKSAPLEVQAAALGSLALVGDEATRLSIAMGAESDVEIELREAAARALAPVDIRAAAESAVAIWKENHDGARPTELAKAILARQQGSTALVKALSGKKIDPNVAKLVRRVVLSTGRDESALVASLTAAGGLTPRERVLSAEEMARWVALVHDQGDAARGEATYRRGELNCQKCHAIAGAGGQVGPDLVSIGASAQVDYLVESLFEPNKKIKENYHSLVVADKDGIVHTGIKLRETDKDLILRDAENRELAVPLDNIEEQANGGSLMPVGLVEELTDNEIVDLVRFLSELGKVGAYQVGRERIARSWQVLTLADNQLRELRRWGYAGLFRADAPYNWQPLYSQVSGDVPLSGAPTVNVSANSPAEVILRTTIEVTTPGAAQFQITPIPPTQAWLDGETILADTRMSGPLKTGRHTLTLAFPAETPEGKIRVEMVEPRGDAAQAQWVSP